MKANLTLLCKEKLQCVKKEVIIKSYPLLHLQKSNATVLYDTAFSFKYLAYRLMNVDISYAVKEILISKVNILIKHKEEKKEKILTLNSYFVQETSQLKCTVTRC